MTWNLRERGWGGSGRLVLLCLTVILVVAAVLRGGGLTASVYGDEAFHFAVADRQAAGLGLTLAPNFDYTRARWFTEAVILCRTALGDHEWAQRLPAYIASLGAVLLIYLLGARMFRPAIGLVAAAVMALDAQSVFFGSYARFYSAAQFFSLLSVYAFDHWFAALEGPAGPRRWRVAAPWIAIFGLSCLAAVTVQIVSLSILLGVAVFLMGRALERALMERRRDWLRWPEVRLLILGAGAAVLAALATWTQLTKALTHVPVWNVHEGMSPFYYVSHLRTAYPFEVLLAIVGLPFAVRLWPRGALLCGSFFVPAFAAHSMLPQKVPRYIFLLVPYLILFAACGYVFFYESVRSGSARYRRGWSIFAAALVVICTCLSPSISRGGARDRGDSWVDWRAAVAQVRGEIRPEDAIVAGVGDDIFAVQQYTGRADAHICTRLWWRSRVKDQPPAGKNPGGPYGVPCLNSVEQFQSLARERGRVWIFLRTQHLTESSSKIAPHEVLRRVAQLADPQSLRGEEVSVLLITRPPTR